MRHSSPFFRQDLGTPTCPKIQGSPPSVRTGRRPAGLRAQQGFILLAGILLSLVPSRAAGQQVTLDEPAGKITITFTIPEDQRNVEWGRFNFVLPEGFGTSKTPALTASVNVYTPASQLAIESGSASSGQLVIGVARTNNAGGTDQVVTDQALEASFTFDGITFPANTEGSFGIVARADRTAAFDPDDPGEFTLTKTLGVNLFEIRLAGGGSIGEQTAGVPFLVRIRALDDEGNIYTPFSGTVELTSPTGELLSGGGETSAFVDGVRDSVQVTLATAGQMSLTAEGSSGSITGVSDTFPVLPGCTSTVIT